MKYPEQGSVYWFDPNPTRGSEINKIRPCLVVSPDEMNKHLKTIIIAPITSNVKDWPFRAQINVAGRKSSVACDQIRSIDKVRLLEQIVTLRPQDKIKVLNLLNTIFS